MKLATRRRRVKLPGGGAVSAVVALPQRFRPGRTPAVLLAHGAGAGMSSPFVSFVKSLGGRIASYLAVAGAPVGGVFFLGYPLHPAGKPDQLRADHLPSLPVPMLFVQGTRDALCDFERLREVLRGVPGAALHVVEGGDHSFRLPRRNGKPEQAVWADIVGAVVRWLAGL
ncbi:MAG: hypothetical protein E6J83_01955 [Deltaproteobacteria bacterium]|nr:MAG: hypothetical protein E6J83_01955 [Deltaproteobacteria bacterium]